MGSAAVGGLAVVVWNRRELTRIRDAGAQPTPVPELKELEEETF